MDERFLHIGAALLIFIVLAGLFAPAANRTDPFLPPCAAHPLGADDAGHDILSDVLRGTRTSLLVGLVVGLAGAGLGILIGGLAGSVIALDAPLMRLVDLFLVVPRLPLIIFLSLFLRPSVWNVILLLALLSWPTTARAVRPAVKKLSQAEFVIATRSLGGSRWYILRRHILPHLFELFAAQVVLEARVGVLAEAGLGFLGIEDPTTKSWGMMLAYAFNHQATFVSGAWKWTVVPPAVGLTLFLLALSMIASGLEPAFNPRTAGARAAASR